MSDVTTDEAADRLEAATQASWDHGKDEFAEGNPRARKLLGWDFTPPFFQERQRGRIQAGLAAADVYDREHDIVRVDCSSAETVERVARALHAVEYGTWSAAAVADHNKWTWDGVNVTEQERDGFRVAARAVLAALQESGQ